MTERPILFSAPMVRALLGGLREASTGAHPMTMPPPVAWQYQPSKVWRAIVTTTDAKIAAYARKEFGLEVESLFTAEQMQAYAAAAVAAEREACALVCDQTPPYPFRPSIEAAHAIRARSSV